MHRAVVVVIAGLIAASAARSDKLCVARTEPAATYRCSVEQPSEKYRLGGSLEQEICTRVLAKKGLHAKCQAVPVAAGGTCQGAERSVTVTDYQRVVGASGESTYEVGALEIARRNVHDTWVCVTSMFKDC